VKNATAELITGTQRRDQYWTYHTGATQTPLATDPRACQVQSGMSGSPVIVRAGDAVHGRCLLPHVRLGALCSQLTF